MAKISILRVQTSPHFIYNVEAVVGPQGFNRRGDVLLVQYLLRTAFGASIFRAAAFPGSPLAVDGLAGPRTAAAIQHFQNVLKSAAVAIVTDGCVTPLIGEPALGALAGISHTIVHLNVHYSLARPSDAGRLSQAFDCPTELRAVLQEPAFL